MKTDAPHKTVEGYHPAGGGGDRVLLGPPGGDEPGNGKERDGDAHQGGQALPVPRGKRSRP